MTLYAKDGMVFVDLNKGYLLCIGTLAEVENASAEKIERMVWEAIKLAQYRSIDSSKNQTVN